MKKIYESPEIKPYLICNADIITASNYDDISPDIWGGEMVDPEIFT